MSLGFVYSYTQSFMKKLPPIDGPVVVNVDKGASFYAVANQLRDLGIIDSPRIFVKIGQFYGFDAKMKFGEYRIEPGMTYRQILEKIASGQSMQYEIIFTPGSHIYDLAGLIEKKKLGSKDEFFKLIKDRKFINELLGENLESLEGYLFPDTYFFAKSDNVKSVVTTMVKRFNEVYKELPQFNGLNRHQVVTLASIVEKETGAPQERPVISSVFHNRLKKKMRLATDPTVIYGQLRKTGSEIKNIKKVHLKEPNPYNTYLNSGLPPGPIGNPGKEALLAAVQPKQTSFLFFVSKNDGTHVFTTNYDDHKAAVKTWQLNPKMRQGRSWRDLNKNSSTN